ncbi:MAG: energy transducer TonB, partial [Nitrospirae bacterium]|nr:energy transducer TonB [Nitrospirota bacterium]
KPARPKISQPSTAARKPFVQDQKKKVVEEKEPPKTIFGDGGAIKSQESRVKSQGKAAPSTRDQGDVKKGVKEELNGFPDEKGVLPQSKDGSAIIPPSSLFDKNTIEKFARKEPRVDRELTFDIPEFKNRGYMRMLKEKIEGIWRYPKEAARLGISGDLFIKFSIKKDGELGEVELLRTSGHKELDEAAVKALKDAEPFWPLPADWKKDDLEINGHFIYIYGRAIIM